jgi:hypothetical protein
MSPVAQHTNTISVLLEGQWIAVMSYSWAYNPREQDKVPRTV